VRPLLPLMLAIFDHLSLSAVFGVYITCRSKKLVKSDTANIRSVASKAISARGGELEKFLYKDRTSENSLKSAKLKPGGILG